MAEETLGKDNGGDHIGAQAEHGVHRGGDGITGAEEG